MTIICALHEPGVGTWIGGDSLVTAQNETVGFTRKWIRKGGAALGFCGSNVVQTLAADAVDFDTSTKPIELFRSIVNTLRQFDFKPKAEEGTTPYWDFSTVFATPDGVARINGCGSILNWFPDGFAATGSGANYAEGAAHALLRSGRSFPEIITQSIQAAIAWDRACGGDIWIDCLRLPA